MIPQGGVDISVYEPPNVGKADFRRAAHCASLISRLCVSNTDTPKPPSIPCAEGATMLEQESLMLWSQQLWGDYVPRRAYLHRKWLWIDAVEAFQQDSYYLLAEIVDEQRRGRYYPLLR